MPSCLCGSTFFALRLIESGAVHLAGAAVSDRFAPYQHQPGAVLQAGKRKLVRLM